MRPAIVTALLLASFANLSGCEKGEFDAREAANALADEFSDMLEFENGTVVNGDPPESDADGPGLDSFTAPLLAGAEETLPDGTILGYDYEQWFPVLFRSRDSLAALEHVKGAIVYVQQANKDDVAGRYLKVEPYELREQIADESVFTFRAVVHRLAELRQAMISKLRSMRPRDVPEGMAAADGNAYHVYIALFSREPDGTEKVGNYVIWNLSTYPGEAGDKVVDMCTAGSRFAGNVLQDTNVVDVRDACDAEVGDAFSDRPSESSPSWEWNRFAAGHNTIVDAVITLANDPDYQERSMVMYPAGTRFFLHGTITSPPLTGLDIPACVLELASCEADEARCDTGADCPTTDHECCDNLCRDTTISDNFCGGCTIQCGGADECQAGLCGQQQECIQDTDCQPPDDTCCEGTCYDGQTDEEHCGGCDIPCAADEECIDGTCVSASECTQDTDCQAPDDLCCDQQCYNSLTDHDHCGNCITPCAAAEECVDGSCVSGPTCTPEMVLAAWDFDDGTQQANELATGLVYRDFTCHDGNPYIDPSRGGFWLAELGWNNELNFLAAILETQAGFELRLVSVTFDQATESLADGPTSWSLRSSEDYDLDLPGTPQPTSEVPEYQTHVVDLSQFTVPPASFLYLLWKTFGATNSQTKWGVDNVVIRGMVCQQSPGP